MTYRIFLAVTAAALVGALIWAAATDDERRARHAANPERHAPAYTFCWDGTLYHRWNALSGGDTTPAYKDGVIQTC